MCHYMMTERRRGQGDPLDGRYAVEAFALFLQHVEAAGTRPAEYQAKLFGGANMFNTTKMMNVGQKNITCGRSILASRSIELVAEHVAGTGRRKLHFDLWSGNAWLAFPEGRDAQVVKSDENEFQELRRTTGR